MLMSACGKKNSSTPTQEATNNPVATSTPSNTPDTEAPAATEEPYEPWGTELTPGGEVPKGNVTNEDLGENPNDINLPYNWEDFYVDEDGYLRKNQTIYEDKDGNPYEVYTPIDDFVGVKVEENNGDLYSEKLIYGFEYTGTIDYTADIANWSTLRADILENPVKYSGKILEVYGTYMVDIDREIILIADYKNAIECAGSNLPDYRVYVRAVGNISINNNSELSLNVTAIYAE